MISWRDSPCSFELCLQHCGLGLEPSQVANHHFHCYSLPIPKEVPPATLIQCQSSSYLSSNCFPGFILLYNAEKSNFPIWRQAEVETEAFNFVVFPVDHCRFHFRLDFFSIVSSSCADKGKVARPLRNNIFL